MSGDQHLARPVVVRALWGDESVVTHQKTLLDVREADQFRMLLNGVTIRVLAFGRENGDFLHSLGYDPIMASELGVVDWLQIGSRREIADDGRINWGCSMWRHKLEAIKLAMALQPAPAGIIWLDWDTKVLSEPNDKLFISLTAGPPFQGRIRQYRSIQCAWRGIENGRRQVYHGGVYYIRDPSIVDRAIVVHQTQHAMQTDEVAISRVVDERFFAEAGAPAEKHRNVGIDNPLLYATRSDAVAADELILPYFREGRMLRPGRLPML